MGKYENVRVENRADSNFIPDKIQWHYIMMTRYESKGFGTEKFDVDNEREEKSGDRARPLSRLLFFFLLFFFLRNNEVNCMQPTTIIPDRYVNPMSSRRDEYCYMLVAASPPLHIHRGGICQKFKRAHSLFDRNLIR